MKLLLSLNVVVFVITMTLLFSCQNQNEVKALTIPLGSANPQLEIIKKGISQKTLKTISNMDSYYQYTEDSRVSFSSCYAISLLTTIKEKYQCLDPDCLSTYLKENETKDLSPDSVELCRSELTKASYAINPVNNKECFRFSETLSIEKIQKKFPNLKVKQITYKNKCKNTIQATDQNNIQNALFFFLDVDSCICVLDELKKEADRKKTDQPVKPPNSSIRNHKARFTVPA